jgi:hypothetical protein
MVIVAGDRESEADGRVTLEGNILHPEECPVGFNLFLKAAEGSCRHCYGLAIGRSHWGQ